MSVLTSGYHHFDMNDAFSVFEHFFGSRDPWEQFEDMVNGNLQRTMSFGRSGSAMGSKLRKHGGSIIRDFISFSVCLQ